MPASRGVCLFAASLILAITGCDNRDITGLHAARQPSPPFDTYARPLNSRTVQVTWADSSPNEIGFRIERAPAVKLGIKRP